VPSAAPATPGSLLAMPRRTPREKTELAQAICGLPAAQAAHVSTALELPELKPYATFDASSLHCSYSGKKHVELFVNLDATSSDMASLKKQYQEAMPEAAVEPHPGFGDEAFHQSYAPKTGIIKIQMHLLAVRRGSIALIMIGDVPYELFEAWATELFAEIK